MAKVADDRYAVNGGLSLNFENIKSMPIDFIVNLGGYSHTSVALRDALLAVPAPKVEVHLSNIFAREDYRHHSFVTSACRGMICGLGLQGYELAIRSLLQ